MEVEKACLKAQHANVLGELQTVGKKEVKHLHDLHSAESDPCSSGEDLFKLKSGSQLHSSRSLLSPACPSLASQGQGRGVTTRFQPDGDSSIYSNRSAVDPFYNGLSTSSLDRKRGNPTPATAQLHRGDQVSKSNSGLQLPCSSLQRVGQRILP